MKRRAFTLLEVIVAMSLMIFLLSVLFQFYRNSLVSRQRGVTSMREAHTARVLLGQITAELRSAGGFIPGFGPGITGDRYTISIQTMTLPNKELFRPRALREHALPAQHDVKQVGYFIAWDEEITDEDGIPLSLGLVRQELKTLRQLVIIAKEADREIDEFREEEEDEDAERSFRLQLYAPEIKHLEFRYFDGAEWHRDWHVAGGNALPQMVRVTIGYETQEQEDLEIGFDEEDFELQQDEIFPPRSYTAYVRLTQADTFFGSRVTRAAADLSEGGI